MSKKGELENALKEAMREQDVVRRNTVRLVLSSVKEAEVFKQDEVEDAEIVAMLQKAVKTRQEAIDEAKKASRPELIEEAEAEIKVLKAFLPAEMSEDELAEIINAAIKESGASTPADMGNVMKIVVPKVQGRADGGKVSQIVRQKLQGE